jgi:hypothetical protein
VVKKHAENTFLAKQLSRGGSHLGFSWASFEVKVWYYEYNKLDALFVLNLLN